MANKGKQKDWRVQVLAEIKKWPDPRERALGIFEHVMLTNGRFIMQSNGSALVVWDDDEEDDNLQFVPRNTKMQKTQDP